MNISIKTPNSGRVTIHPDDYADVCPIIFAAGATPKQKRKARIYCHAEGWIDLAEERLDPPLDREILAFLQSI